MIYVDTSVLVALHLNEPNSHLAERWFVNCTQPMVSALWCVTEFASALGIKQRTGQINMEQATAAWSRFERQCANELQLVSVDAHVFHKAAILTLNTESKLRAEDSLHLACAVELKVDALATFDAVLAVNCERLKLKRIFPVEKLS